MHIAQVPVLQDNYSHLIVDHAQGVAAVVDPAEAEPVLAAVRAAGLRLVAVLLTHHHYDHIGGVPALLRALPDLQVVGAAVDAHRLPPLGQAVSHDDTVQVGALTGRVLSVPCHTTGHVAYVFGDALFCGDTLFVGGCGRFFEGDGAQMHRALYTAFGALPDDTRVFCAHEYTVSNLRFACSLDPENAAATDKLRWAEAKRAVGQATVPSTLGEERAYNPFMRIHTPAIQAATGRKTPAEVMDAVRALKNTFRG